MNNREKEGFLKALDEAARKYRADTFEEKRNPFCNLARNKHGSLRCSKCIWNIFSDERRPGCKILRLSLRSSSELNIVENFFRGRLMEEALKLVKVLPMRERQYTPWTKSQWSVEIKKVVKQLVEGLESALEEQDFFVNAAETTEAFEVFEKVLYLYRKESHPEDLEIAFHALIEYLLRKGVRVDVIKHFQKKYKRRIR